MKFIKRQQVKVNDSRSRKGAWIEISITVFTVQVDCRRSRKGAWIEICCDQHGNTDSADVAPVRERGLKYLHNCFITLTYNVAPVRERGLKCSLIV